MQKISIQLISFFLIFFINPVLAMSQSDSLPDCEVITHCVRVDWEVSDTDDSFDRVLEIILGTPRTKIVEKTDTYLHAEVTSRIMRYVDDLEIKVINKDSILQVRSESRVGIGDMGVNQKRVDNLAYRLTTNQ